MNQKLKSRLLLGSKIAAIVIGGIGISYATNGTKRNYVCSEQYVQGWIDHEWVRLTVPKENSFKIEPEMLILKQKRSGDTILRIANFSHTAEAIADSSVLSVRTITNIKIVE